MALDTKFQKGHIPWNKGLKGIHLSPETEFKKGMIPWNKGKAFLQLRGENNPNWKGGKLKFWCKQCGKEYFRDRDRKNRTKFCSRSCKAKYYFTGAMHPNWKGGIDKWSKLKESEIYKRWRMRVFYRDRFTCKLCGYRSRESRAHGDKISDICAHHIIPRKENPKLSLKAGNGITLCQKCHRMTYGKEHIFAMVFKGILRDYTPSVA